MAGISGLRVSGNIIVCPTPLQYDGYWGCSGRCAYCFARSAAFSNIKARKKNFQSVEEREVASPGILSGVGVTAASIFAARGHALHVGGMADPFQEQEVKAERTLDVMAKCAAYNVPLIVSTKYGQLLDDRWREAWRAVPRKLLQVSLIATDDVLDELEAGALSWRDRLALLKELSADGPVMVRLQPFIIGLSDRSLPRWAEHLAEAGVSAASVEGLKLPVRNNAAVADILKRHLGARFSLPGTSAQSDICYSMPEQLAYQLAARRALHGAGILHYAADNALRWLGDSPACCGSDLLGAPHSTLNWGDLSCRAAAGEAVSWDAWNAEHHELHSRSRGDFGINSKDGPTQVKLMQKHGETSQVFRYQVREWWSNPKSGVCPGRVVPFLRPVAFDANGLPVWGFRLPEWARRMLGDDWTYGADRLVPGDAR